MGKITPGNHQILNTTQSITFAKYNHGIDTRFGQEKADWLVLEDFNKYITRMNYLHMLQSQRVSPLLKEQIAKKIIYNEDEPYLAICIKAGGLMSGSDFDDDDFDKI
tara:strand:- start:227 stop:547 length:321 start_codon:yes stop_codon:yes gene_type:complete